MGVVQYKLDYHKIRLVLYSSVCPTILGEDMAFWKKKDKDDEEKCPLCSTVVTVDDTECPLCFYELKLSPRHQSLNITATEEDSLIGLLNSDVEDEEEEIIREVEDVINLDAEEITVEAKYDDDDDDDDFISISTEHAPEFVTSRMTPSGVAETDADPKDDVETIVDEEEMDLGGISIPKPPSHEDVEYDEISVEPEEIEDKEEENVELNSTTPVELPPPPAPVELPPPPAPVELPPPPAPVELPPPPAPQVQTNSSPYTITEAVSSVAVSSENSLNIGSVWPWPAKDEWDSKDLRKELLDAMAAAKIGDNVKVDEALEHIGPHLGSNIELLFHIGVLLKKLGREYELIQMLTKAQVQYPNNSDVVNAVSKLT